MKTIKPIIAPFMALFLAMFLAVVPAHASGLTFGGYHDDGVGSDGNHYFELYWYSTDPNVDCAPTSGSDGYISVQFYFADKLSGGGWVQAFDVTQSYAGQSGFSQRECQVNVYAANGAGERMLFMSWTLNGTLQTGNPSYTVTF